MLRGAALPTAGARRRTAPAPARPAVTPVVLDGLRGSGRLLPFDLPRALGRAADGDLDLPRPHGLRHLAPQLDRQQAVLEAGAPPPRAARPGGGPRAAPRR